MTSETARGRATRTMPATAFEMLLPRPVWVVVAVGMAALSLFVSGAAVESVVGGSGWGAAGTAVAIAGAVTAWLMTATVVTITLVRPPLRGTATRMPGHEASGGVALRGSRRISVMVLLSALATSTFAVLAAVASTGGWRVVWIVVAALLAVRVVDHAIGVAHPRGLVLTPTSVRASSFGVDGDVRWEDVDDIRWVQGRRDGIMVAGIRPKEGVTPVVHWRHPLWRRPRDLDVELSELGSGPLLVMMALVAFWQIPDARGELAVADAAPPSGSVSQSDPLPLPLRFTDPVFAAASVPYDAGERWLTVFRPR
ncbi:hypothetical protein [Microbacterium aurum]